MTQTKTENRIDRDTPLIVGQIPTEIQWDDDNPLKEIYLELGRATSQTDFTRRLDNLRHKRLWGP